MTQCCTAILRTIKMALALQADTAITGCVTALPWLCSAPSWKTCLSNHFLSTTSTLIVGAHFLKSLQGAPVVFNCGQEFPKNYLVKLFVRMTMYRCSLNLKTENWNHHLREKAKSTLKLCTIKTFYIPGYGKLRNKNSYKLKRETDSCRISI